KTTLDGRPAMRATFDKLVAGLVEMSGSAGSVGEVGVTDFALCFDTSDAEYDDADATYDYYGPITVDATLTGARGGGNLNEMDKLFLTVDGVDSGEVQFVSKAGAVYTALPTDTLFGTTRDAQCVAGSGTGTTWESDEFYLMFPKGRLPARGDELLVRAFGMAPDVPVAEGTPIVYAFTPPDSDGVQDWNAIQAFIGGASKDAIINLYAEAKWNTGETTLGKLYVQKKVENASLETIDHTFTFAVYYNTAENGAPAPAFDPEKRLNLTDHPVFGAFSVDIEMNTFTLKNGGKALIESLPMVVGGGDAQYTYYYWVEEMAPGVNYGAPHFELSSGVADKPVVDGTKIGPFKLSEVLGIGYVTVTNTYEHDTGSLKITKKLSGTPGDWGVDNTTVFTARVKDVTGNNYVLFDLQPDGTYKANGNSGSPTPSNNTRELVRFSVNSAATLTNLWAGRKYLVEETPGEHYTAAYTGNNVSFPNKGSEEVVVTNTYEHGTGSMVITKKLADTPEDWGVDGATVFSARIKDVTGNNYLLFEIQANGTYKAVGNNGSSMPTNDLRELVKFTADTKAVLTDLWAGRVYKVEETPGEHYTASYTGNNVSFPTSGNGNVVITNTYEHGTGSMMITKKLAGFPEDWGVDKNTVFTARVKDVSDNNFVLFELQKDGTYKAVGNSGKSEPTNDKRELVSFTAGSAAELTNLWAGHIYQVIEVSGSHYTPEYEGNNVSFPESGNMIVVVKNTYEHGTGSLIIRKDLSGCAEDWEVDNATVFTARVKDVTDGNYVFFDLQPDGTYKANGNSGSPTPSANAREIVAFTAGGTAQLTHLWAGHVYQIQETEGEHYTASYTGNDVIFSESGNGVVTITNTYDAPEKPKTGESSMALWLWLFGASLLGLCTVLAERKRVAR
ncbi:MAG: hypothetical protein FWE69_07945, partial [Clostridiales bacterium]|nr:hypothetical protein [Clostridiales bacterium]